MNLRYAPLITLFLAGFLGNSPVQAMHPDDFLLNSWDDDKPWHPSFLATTPKILAEGDTDHAIANIQKIQNPQNAKNLLIAYINQSKITQLLKDVRIIDILMYQINQLDPQRTNVTFTDATDTVLPALIRLYDVYRDDQKNLVTNNHLAKWTTWFLNRGIPVNQPDSQGLTPLGAAVYTGHADTVRILLARGASRDQKYTSQRGMTVNANEELQDTLNFMGEDKGARWLAIQALFAAPPASTSKFAFTRTKALWTGMVAALGLAVGYSWFSRKKEATEKQDVLINSTDETIYVTHYDIQGHESFSLARVLAHGKLALPTQGTLEIIRQLNPEKPLPIQLDRYATERTDNYLNLVISKNWFSWIFGPLGASPRWVAKENVPTQ